MHATIYYLDRPIAASQALMYLADEFFSSSPIIQVRVNYPPGKAPQSNDIECLEHYVGQFVDCFAGAGLSALGEKSMVVTEEQWSSQLQVSVISAIERITGVMPWIVRVYYEPDGTYKETLVLDSAIYDGLSH